MCTIFDSDNCRSYGKGIIFGVLRSVDRSNNAIDSVFIVKSYVENTDIAKIHEGMDVTYEIGAYPSREYGTSTYEKVAR